MMNMFKLSEQLQDFSKDQLVNEMQRPSGNVPQFLVLTELQRRTRMEQDAAAANNALQSTVAEDAVSAAGVPQAGIAGMARSLAPRTDVTQNTGIAGPAMPAGQQPVQRMQEGGPVGPASATYNEWMAMSRGDRERAGLPVSWLGGQNYYNRFGVGLGLNDPETGAPLASVPSLGSSGRPGQRPEPEYRPSEMLGVSEGSRGRPDTRPGRDYTVGDTIDTSPGSREGRGRRPPAMSRGNPLDPNRDDLLPPTDYPEALPMDTGTPLYEQNLGGDLLPPAPNGEGGAGGAGGVGGAGSRGASPFSDLDRMYEQDRWLSLARFGLGLMSSRAPTFGGAIGEAGTGALDYMNSARDSMMDRRVQEQQLAMSQEELDIARIRANRTGGVRNIPLGVVTANDDMIENLQEQLADPGADMTRDEQLRLTAQLTNMLAERDYALRLYQAQYGIGGPGMQTLADQGPDYDGSDTAQ